MARGMRAVLLFDVPVVDQRTCVESQRFKSYTDDEGVCCYFLLLFWRFSRHETNLKAWAVFNY